MSRNRFGQASEHSNHYIPSAKKSVSTGLHSPRKGLFAGPISNQLHRTPVAVAVSATGERTICPVDSINIPMNVNSTNPFASDHKTSAVLESSSGELIQKYPKRQRVYFHRRRKIQEKERRRAAKIILTQRNTNKSKPQVMHKCVSVQTDPSIIDLNRTPELIGDAAKETFKVSISPRTEKRSVGSIKQLSFSNKKFTIFDNFFAQFMPALSGGITALFGIILHPFGKVLIFFNVLMQPFHEAQVCVFPRYFRGDLKAWHSVMWPYLTMLRLENLKILTSFMIMTILIFWLTSIILDVEVPSDFFRMASNYVRSFKWGNYNKQPQTNAEKCLAYLTKLFK